MSRCSERLYRFLFFLALLAGCGHPESPTSAVALPTLPLPSPPPPPTRVIRPIPAVDNSPTASPTLALPVSTVIPLADSAALISAFSFADALHGWVALGTRLLSTENGGASWATIAELDAPIVQLHALSAQAIWARVGDQLMSSTDGGVTWVSLVTQPNGPRLVDVVDPLHAWAYDRAAALLRTTDGGQRWEQIREPCEAPDLDGPGRFDFLTPQLGWVLCPHGSGTGYQAKTLYSTADGGTTWQLVVRSGFGRDAAGGFPGSGYAVGFAVGDTRHAWLTVASSGMSALLVTADGGLTWASRSGSEYGLFSPLEARSANRLTSLLSRAGRPWAVVASGDGGATWRPVFPALRPRNLPMFVDATHGFSANTPLAQGAVLATTDGGATWEQRATLPFERVGTLVFTDRLHGCIAGSAWDAAQATSVKRTYETHDGGFTWATEAGSKRCTAQEPPDWQSSLRDNVQIVTTPWGEVRLPTSLQIEGGAVRFIDGKRGWLMLSGGEMYTTTDGGATWRQIA